MKMRFGGKAVLAEILKEAKLRNIASRKFNMKLIISTYCFD
jgi:hypothetical protein